MRGKPTAAEWKTHVYSVRHAGIGNGVRVLLLYLADHMRVDRTVSVPRSTLAKALNVTPSEITWRIKAATEAGLLDTVVRGRPGVTAVYQGSFSVASLGQDGVTKKGRQHGTGNPTIKRALLGKDGVATNSKHEEASALGLHPADAQLGNVKPKAPRRREEAQADSAAESCSARGCSAQLQSRYELECGFCETHMYEEQERTA